ncbi:MAG: hypothetical protein LBU97_04775 [Alistipes sp.]|jgi:hypothetical protein|nr:hypothetical protein [Alistipes sp.]
MFGTISIGVLFLLDYSDLGFRYNLIQYLFLIISSCGGIAAMVLHDTKAKKITIAAKILLFLTIVLTTWDVVYTISTGATFPYLRVVCSACIVASMTITILRPAGSF